MPRRKSHLTPAQIKNLPPAKNNSIFSMEIRPNGASIGNAVENFRQLGKGIAGGIPVAKDLLQGKNILGEEIKRRGRVRPVLGSFKKGGTVKKTGLYQLHKGEKVMPMKKCK